MNKNVTILSENLCDYHMRIRKEAIVSKYTLPARPSKDGYFRVYVNDVSGRRQLAAKSIEELVDKIYAFENLSYNSKTFSEIFDIIEESTLSYIKNYERKLSAQNTLSKRRNDYNRFIKGTRIEYMPINTITKHDVESIIIENLTRYDLKPKAYEGLCYVLKTVFKYAYEEYLVDDNVYQRVDLKRFKHMICAPTPVSERAYTTDELKLILDDLHLRQSAKPSYMPLYAVECQILMGLRRGEVPPLEWTDVTSNYIIINKEQILVRKTETEKSRMAIVHHTKTYKDRMFPMVDYIQEFISRLRIIDLTYYPSSKYLFPAPNQNGVITNESIYNCYARTISRLGLKRTGVTMGTHSFRRNAITDAVNNTNGNLVLVSELFGNSPKIIMSNYYTGFNLSDSKEAISKRDLTNS